MNTDETNIERFIGVYTEALKSIYGGNEAWLAKIPPDIKKETSEETFKALAIKMTNGFIRGAANKDSNAVKRTCKELGIKHTYAAIKDYILS